MIEICLEQDMSLFQHPHLTWLPVSIPYTGELPARYLWRTGPQPCISLNFTEVGEETVIQRQCLLAEPTIIPSLGNLNKGIHKKIIQGKRGNKWKISRHLRDSVPVENTRGRTPNSLLIRSWDPEKPIPDAEYLWDPFSISHISKSPLSELAWVRSKAIRYNII